MLPSLVILPEASTRNCVLPTEAAELVDVTLDSLAALEVLIVLALLLVDELLPELDGIVHEFIIPPLPVCVSQVVRPIQDSPFS